MLAVALLAPVPLEHLEDGQITCKDYGKVAFGTRAWEVFRKLDAIRNGTPVNVYIYASQNPDCDRLEVSWLGRYVNFQPAENGRHPNPLFRPPSTHEEDRFFDLKTAYVGFWELDQLKCLLDEDRITTGSFCGYETGREYKKNFVPEGPTLVIQPSS